MFNSLKFRLLFSNITVIAITIALILIFINIFAAYEFNIYKVNELEKVYNDIYDIVSQQYQNDKWDTWVLETVGTDILQEKNIIITLYDDNDKMLYNSASTQNKASANTVTIPTSGHGHMRRGYTYNVYENNEEIQQIEGFNEKKYEVINKGSKVGLIVLSSTEYYDTNDLNYLNRITQIIIIIGIIAILLAAIVSSFISNKISLPISNITNVAGDISRGNFGKIVNEKTTISELCNLIRAINNLSGNLERHEMLRKRLTHDIAHELRTPISTMQGNLEAVLDGVWVMEEDRIKSLYEEVLRLSRLVADLNNLSKYENAILNKSSFDICDVLEYVLNNFEAMLLEKKIQVNVTVKPIQMYADKDKLIQVFTNLMSNAVKFTLENGSIYINASKHNNGSELAISFADTGIGISEEDLPYIFERFYKSDKSRSRKNGGAGIGLSVVKAVVEAHGGSVRVKSEFGKGTEFIMSIPHLG